MADALQHPEDHARKLSLVDTHFELTREKTAALTAKSARAAELVDLEAVSIRAWASLHARATEPNPFYAPEWALAVTKHVPGDENIRALLAWDSPAKQKLIGFLPVTSTWRALKLPLPALVTWHGYAPLATPLLDKDQAIEAAAGLLSAAREAGAHALLFSVLADEGPAAQAMRAALARKGRVAKVLHREARALFDATANVDTQLQDALGS
jgi:hypothetical protein